MFTNNCPNDSIIYTIISMNQPISKVYNLPCVRQLIFMLNFSKLIDGLAYNGQLPFYSTFCFSIVLIIKEAFCFRHKIFDKTNSF